jgi:transcriptional regulator GlxA family with amidase domain
MQTRAFRTAILAFDELDLLDLTAPLAALTQAGRRWNFRPFRIQVAAPRAGRVTTRNQLAFDAEQAWSELEPAEIVLVPGGYGARRVAETPELVRELARIAGSARLVAGIGWGVYALAAAGLVGARRVASGPDVEVLLRATSPEARLESSGAPVFDAPLLTARAGGSALEVGLTLVEKSFGPKLRAMLEADLGLSRTERIDIVGAKLP